MPVACSPSHQQFLANITTGLWTDPDIRYGDVIKLYITCQVLRRDIPGTIYNIALKLLGKERLNTNKYVLV